MKSDQHHGNYPKLKGKTNIMSIENSLTIEYANSSL